MISTPPPRIESDADDTSPPIDPDDPRLDAFVEALACALLEDMESNPQR